MRVKVLCRNPDEYLRETKRDIFKVPRNYSPELHPLEGPREYTRALNAIKLERVFAKPFVGNLDGHREGVTCFGKHPERLSLVSSGSYDGEVCFWDLPSQTCVRRFQAHSGFVRGLTFVPDGNGLLSVGDDKTVKTWNTDSLFDSNEEPIETRISKTVLTGITHHQKKDIFATCGEACLLWEETRNSPIQVYEWGVDTLLDVTFNAVETDLLLSCASDRSIIIYDVRDCGPVKKFVMSLRTNKLCWNPMEATVFTCANEDYNLYTFDVRNLRSAVQVHKNHVSAVTCVDYAPTGREFVSGSFDKSIRIFEIDKANSRDIYHTKRMQHVTSVAWSLDNKYVLSGSDEMNVRVWKARASEKLGALRPREKNALNYSAALREKYASHPQIKRIARHRQVPKHIQHAKKELSVIRTKLVRKEINRRKHAKPGAEEPYVPERKKSVIDVQQ
ncbi:hypothetical protein R5R35_012768 [Gryllus longicercus]|uniref:DDB1- and CUL4-associated factor 13 n=1 Tax=Gryllus longicercus TaxID=2509291 RepID=A0AAN9VS79_9ORTH